MDFSSALWLSTQTCSQSISSSASQRAILSICLVFLLLRTHLRAVSCNSVVTLPVISNSLYTPLSICTPSPGKSVTYYNIVAVDNPVGSVTIRLIHHNGKPHAREVFLFFFIIIIIIFSSSLHFFWPHFLNASQPEFMLANLAQQVLYSIFQTHYQLYFIPFSSVFIWKVLDVNCNETCLFSTSSRAIWR